MRCYCSICRKTNGGGGYAINIMGLKETLEVTGEDLIETYRLPAEETESGGDGLSESRRRFCSNCGSGLFVFNPNHGKWVYPFASIIDTDLPVPPERNHIMLKYKPDWVPVPEGPEEHRYETYPSQSIREWHASRNLLMDV
ncbi:MAG: GFA family protein [bacterium]